MAFGKYSRVDGRKSSSSYCSTVTLVVFVALCLVGVWMMTSSSVVPVQNVDKPSQESKNEVQTTVNKSHDSSASDEDNTGGETNTGTENTTKQFEDNPGDLPEDATKGEANVSVVQEEKSSNSQENTNLPEKTTENVSLEEKPEGKYGKQNVEEEKNSGDASRTDRENGEGQKDEESKTVGKDSEAGKTPIYDEKNSGGQGDSEEGLKENKSDLNESEKKSNDNTSETKEDDNGEGQVEENVEQKQDKESPGEKKEVFPSGAQSELLKETATQNGSFLTQAEESKDEKDVHKSSEPNPQIAYSWKLCNVTAGSDYIPCLDNWQAIKSLRTTKHYEHRERHCPEEPPTCLVALPEGYRRSIEWPTSRDKIWYHNVPHTKLAEVKGHQNWVKVSGEYLTFPGGGTQFKHGALHYIDFIQQFIEGHTCEREVIGGDVVLIALVPWHIEGGKLLLELNRLLRPGGIFVWSATPVYQKLPEDAEIWEAMQQLTKSMCWEIVSISKDRVNGVGIAIYKKPMSNECYEKRLKNDPPLCEESDDPSAAWNVPLQACMHKVPADASKRGSQWPEQWPARLEKPPYWLLSSQVGVYGKAAPEDFTADYEHWKRVVTKSYINGMGINWSTVRNVMDMRSIYGGFAAALRELNVWVVNVVTVDSPDTLPIIYDRGLFGVYHDWCESFSTYPRSYDLLHADHLFSKIKKKCVSCKFEAFVAEVDRILRPEGKLIVRDKVEIISELESLLKAMRWEVRLIYSKDAEGLLCVQKTMWRPKEMATITYAIA
ncbi:hypothetical protein RJ639_015009 [Escallonia herrerae]|uniref:Methyltransferase PMT26 n=1 Tax=Escallonia herrerae TaxID=1293975 RepID=A0AA88VNB6_9ASTE|nr:hypothetical protein RJ639_015009 [Escallonia herrerae]